MQYWQKREEERIKLRKRDDDVIRKKIVANYEKTLNEVEKEINSFYAKYARENGVTWKEAKRRLDKQSRNAYQVTSKDVAEAIKGNKDAEDRLKLYNLTSNLNRYEQLRSMLGIQLTKVTADTELLLYDTMIKAYKSEIDSLKDVFKLTTLGYNDKYAASIVNASYHNATWSDRLWANQEALKARLDEDLRTMLTRGDNPRKYRKQWQDAFKQGRMETERILITETARVQSETMFDEYEKMGFSEGIWVTEANPCSICSALSGTVEEIKVLREMLPRHPFCRCSVAPYADRKEYERKNKL